MTPYTQAYVATGVNSPPTMGWLLELSNGGFVGLILWLGFTLSVDRSLKRVAMKASGSQHSWSVARWSFLGAAAIYLLAAGFLSSIWSLFMGLGFAASFMRHRELTNDGPTPHRVTA